MKKVLLLFTLLASLGLNALTEKEKAIAFMKDWVTFANGKMEVYQRNVVTGKVRLLTTTKDGVWVTIDVKMKEDEK